MSFTSVLLPILAALGGAEQFMGLSTHWQPVNSKQEKLVAYLPQKEEQFAKLSAQELKTIASFDYQEINKFLKDHKFDIQLEPFSGLGSFGVASILDILLEWEQEGTVTTLKSDNKEYPAVVMEIKPFHVYRVGSHEHPILRLTAKNGDHVYMTIAQKNLSGFELFTFIQELSKEPQLKILEWYDDVIFPMVELNHETDISWLLRLGTARLSDNMPFEITQALQQTKFKMNEKGARAQSAAAICVAKTCCKQPKTLLINKPFYLWIERPGMSMPLFTAYIDTADWKQPADLTA